MSLKNFVDTDIIKGNDKPLMLLSVATLKCPKDGLKFAVAEAEADLELLILQRSTMVARYALP